MWEFSVGVLLGWIGVRLLRYPPAPAKDLLAEMGYRYPYNTIGESVGE